MPEIENLENLTVGEPTSDKSHTALSVVIPVIAAAAGLVGAFVVRKLRRPVDSSTPLTLIHDETPVSEDQS